MRILHLVHSYPPCSYGGTELHVRSIAREQAARGNPVCIMSATDMKDNVADVKAEPVEGIPVLRVPWQPWEASTVDGRNSLVRQLLQTALMEHRPDLIHLHHWSGLTSDAVLTSRNAGIPSVVSLHDYYATCPLFHRLPGSRIPCRPDEPRDTCIRCLKTRFLVSDSDLNHALDQRVARFRSELDHANAILALSGPEKTYLDRIPWLENLLIQVLPLPRPELPAMEPPLRTPRPGGQIRLVSWGGLDPGKGLDIAVKACEVTSRPGRFSLDHFGRILDEDFRKSLTAMAVTMRLTFHGTFTEEDMVRAFPLHDLAVFPSLYMETHGFVVDEALILGLPVLVSDLGAPPERIGQQGRAFPAGDVQALARILETILHDPDVLTRMKQGDTPPPVTLAAHMDALMEIYEAVVRQGPR